MQMVKAPENLVFICNQDYSWLNVKQSEWKFYYLFELNSQKRSQSIKLDCVIWLALADSGLAL